MPKKNSLSIKTSINNSTLKKKLANSSEPPLIVKRKNNTNSILWLQEAYDSARGEKSLWVAVITQAVMDALSRSRKSEAIYQKYESIRWLSGSSKDFIDVCMAADMNPDYVRRKAKQVIASPIPWRAEAGKGKRYEERREYRKKQRILEALAQAPCDPQPKVISIF